MPRAGKHATSAKSYDRTLVSVGKHRRDYQPLSGKGARDRIDSRERRKHVKLSNVRGKLACGFKQWSALFCSQIGLFAQLTIQRCPGLVRLVQDDETIEELLRLPPEAILLRWFNYHLQEAGHVRRVSNFSTDISDAENYSVLLHQVKRLRPPHTSRFFVGREKIFTFRLVCRS